MLTLEQNASGGHGYRLVRSQLRPEPASLPLIFFFFGGGAGGCCVARLHPEPASSAFLRDDVTLSSETRSRVSTCCQSSAGPTSAVFKGHY